MDYTTFNQLTFVLYLILALVLLYQSWINLVKKRVTKFSLDAVILAYIRIRRGEESLDRAKRLLINEPNRLRVLGIWALISGIALMYMSIDSYAKFIR